MGLLGDIWSGVTGSGTTGADAIKGYDQAQQYLQPWQQAGQQAVGDLSGYLNTIGGDLKRYGNPADWMWSNINQSPQDFYQTLMGGYEQSPQYQQQMADMEKALTNAGAASGMTGSGSFYNNWMRNAQNITAQDQDRWLNNMLRSTGQQQSYLGDYRGVQNAYLQGLGGLAQMGQGAANTMGNQAIGQGAAQSGYQAANNPWGNVANIGASMYLGGVPKYGGQGTYFT